MTNASHEAAIREAFPEAHPGASPLGARLLVQIKSPKKKTMSSGIVLVEETKEIEKWNSQVAKVIAIGPLAFCKRDSMEPWPEGAWCSVGDFIRVPKWGGDRWEVNIPGSDEKALFCIFNDHEIIAKVTSDPLSMNIYI